MLTKIRLEDFQDKIEWLWEKVRTQDYAFDDNVTGNSQAFLMTLFHPDSRHWYNDSGMVSVVNIQKNANANIHFILWDKEYGASKVLADANQVFYEVFKEFELERITATIPQMLSGPARLAVALGMKYEGTMRRAFLHGGEYYNLFIYGILQQEWKEKQWAD